MASFVGTNGNDTFNGTAGGDSFDGRGGNDTMQGQGGDDYYIMSFGGTSSYGTDTIDGGAGTDTLDFGPWAQSALIINLAAGTLSGGGVGGAGGGTIAGIERVVGGQFGDQITGAAASETLAARGGNDTVLGGGGNDQLLGEWGDDSLDGGAGNDTLTGGQGADSFLFTLTPGAANADTITDFTTALDKIRLDAAVMTQLGAAGNFTASDARFAANSSGSAQDGTDRVIYNTSNGQLLYDADGNGSGAALVIATVQGAPTLTATDIAVFGSAPPGDAINGTEGDDNLVGTDEDDTINGLGGSDTINGKGGNDTLSGGAAPDQFFFDQAPGAAHADTITDFTIHSDDLVLDLAAMPALGSPGGFASGDDRFHSAAGATGGADAEDRVVYNTSTGQVLYDADGSGPQAALLIATLQGAPGLTPTDIVVTGAPSGGATEGDDVLIGTEGDDFIDGLGGNDTIDGLGGSDTLVGGAGNDEITSAGLDDDVDGGAGTDTHIVNVGDTFEPSWTVIAGPGIEVLVVRDYEGSTSFDRPRAASGNELDNVIRDEGLGGLEMDGGAGNDTLTGGVGNNVFYAPTGSDVIDGGGGTDALWVFGVNGPATIDFSTGIVTATGGSATFSSIEVAYGSSSDDVMIGGNNAVRFYGSGGNDLLTGGAGNDFLSGDEGYDPTGFGSGDDVISGLGGNDQIWGFSGNDRLSGGEGNDFLNGGPNVNGGPDADHFVFDVVAGSANADTVSDFVSGSDTIELDGRVFAAIGPSGDFLPGDPRFAANGSGTAQDGSDRIIYNTVSGQLWYDADGDGTGAALLIATLDGAPSLAATDVEVINGSNPGEHIVGTSGNDLLNGTQGDDTIEGLGGNDTINMQPAAYGNDQVDGGAGTDSLNFNFGGAAPVLVDFRTGTASSTLGTVSFVSIERVVATPTDDHLIGGAGAQNLSAVGGHDTVEGGAGNNWLWGGAGNDRFIFRETGNANADNFGDFSGAADKIVLDASVMTALGGTGEFAAGDARFWAAAGATSGHDADDRVVYNTTTRQLFYDADGNGAGAAQLLGTLQSGATLSATNIVVEGGAAPSEPTEGDDHLVGTPGDDTIDGLGGNDIIEGLGGNDTLTGGNGEDTLRGGDGDDSLDGADEFPPPAADILDGGMGNDVYRVDSADTIVADSGGVDTVVAWKTSWTLGPGLENLDLDDVGAGADGTGNELDNIIRGPGEGGTILGLGGNDTLILRNAQNTTTARGGEGNDTLVGGWRGNLFGDAGDDLFDGAGVGAINIMTGGTGADVFLFDDNPDFTENSITDFATSVDTIRLDAAVMSPLGANGRFSAGDVRFAANSSGSAQDASDRVVYNTSNGQLWYDADGSGGGAAVQIALLQGAPALAATDIEVINGTTGGPVITGTSGGDNMVGTNGDETLDALGGNDSLEGRGGSDALLGGNGDDYFIMSFGGTSTYGTNERIDGGAGMDTLDFGPWAQSALTINLAAGTLSGGGVGGAGGGTIAGIERLVGGFYGDTITGSAAAEVLSARAGNDTVLGGGGNDQIVGDWGSDWLSGGAGNDTLTGNQDSDSFVFDVAPGAANADTITDFTTAADKIRLDDAVHAGIGALGNFAAGDGRFAANASGTAQDGADRVVYNTSTGQLYYDADGSGAGAAQLIATLQGAPGVTATDISVI